MNYSIQQDGYKNLYDSYENIFTRSKRESILQRFHIFANKDNSSVLNQR